MIEVGDVVTLRVEPLDSDRNSVDVTNLGLIVTLPDGTSITSASPVHDGLGAYSYNFVTAQAGRHVARWAGDGYAFTDTFNVWPADPRYMFNLQDARRSIGQTGDDDQLLLYIAATTSVIEDIVGPVIPATRSETFGGCASALLLKDMNVTVASVSQNGTTLTEGSDFTVAAEAGIVYAGMRDSSKRFGSYPITVQYTTGAAAIPANVLLAGIEELRFLWQQGQQGNRPSFGNDPDTEAWTPSGFAVPRRVIELCGNDRRKAWRPA